MTKYISAILLMIVVIAFSCRKVDDTPPIITINPPDTLYQILNEVYTDPGATATDEADGNITGNIYIKNSVDVNKVGEYTVVYTVVDKQGNEAAPATRWVFVYNQALANSGTGKYDVTETQVCPNTGSSQFTTIIAADSTVNNRIVFSRFSSDYEKSIYGDIEDTTIIIPYQIFDNDSTVITFLGSGKFSDTLISLQYKKTVGLEDSWWDAVFIKK